MFIVCMKEHKTLWTCAQIFVEFAFCMDYSLKRAKTFQMGPTHIGYQSAVGLGYPAQSSNFAGMVGSGFDNGYLMFLGEPKKGFGYADMVVEIALRIEHVKLTLQHGCRKFLGGGFSVGSRYLQNGASPFLAVMGGQVLQRF